MTSVRPYGDSTGDGLVQLSFTLPLGESERARQAALELVRKMGFSRPQVAHMKGMGPDFTYFIVYGASEHMVDPDEISVEKRDYPSLTPPEVNLMIREKLKRPLVVVGACTGTDAHTVGLDAILNVKGFAGDKGLEHYHEMRVINMGAQVRAEEVVDTIEVERADAILISQAVTQRDAHIKHLREVREALEATGQRERVLLVGGGPRLSPEQAMQLGYDRIFGRGTRPSDVASYLAWGVRDRVAGMDGMTERRAASG